MTTPGNFGNKKLNRTYAVGIGEIDSGKKKLGTVENLAVLKDYCGGKASNSCCCEKKYGVKHLL